MLRLSMALVPLLLGSFMFGFHLQWRMNNLTLNLSWPFALPIALGSAAFLFWLRAQWKLRNESSCR